MSQNEHENGLKEALKTSKKREKSGPKLSVFGKRIIRSYSISEDLVPVLHRIAQLYNLSASSWIEWQIVRHKRALDRRGSFIGELKESQLDEKTPSDLQDLVQTDESESEDLDLLTDVLTPQEKKIEIYE